MEEDEIIQYTIELLMEQESKFSDQLNEEVVVGHALLEDETCESVFSENTSSSVKSFFDAPDEASSNSNWLSLALASDGVASIRRARALFKQRERDEQEKKKEVNYNHSLLLLVDECDSRQLLFLCVVLGSMLSVHCARASITGLLNRLGNSSSQKLQENFHLLMQNPKIRLSFLEYIKLVTWRGPTLYDSIKYDRFLNSNGTRVVVQKILYELLLLQPKTKVSKKGSSLSELLLASSLTHLKRASARQYDMVCWGCDGSEQASSAMSLMLDEESLPSNNGGVSNIFCLRNGFLGESHVELSDEDTATQPNVEWATWVLKVLMDAEDAKTVRLSEESKRERFWDVAEGVYSSKVLSSLLNTAETPNMPLKDAVFRLCARTITFARKHLLNHSFFSSSKLKTEVWSRQYLRAVPETKLLQIFTSRLRKERPHRVKFSAYLKGLVALLSSVRLLRQTSTSLNHGGAISTNVTTTDQSLTLIILDVASDSVTLSWSPRCNDYKIEMSNDVQKKKQYVIQYAIGSGQDNVELMKGNEIMDNIFHCYDEDPHTKYHDGKSFSFSSCEKCKDRAWRTVAVLDELTSSQYCCTGLKQDTPYRFRIGVQEKDDEERKDLLIGSKKNMHIIWGPTRRVDTELGPVLMLSPNSCGKNLRLSNKNMTVQNNVNKKWNAVRASTGFTRGIHNWCVYVDKCVSKNIFLGVVTASASLENYVGADNHGWGYLANKAIWHNKGKSHTYGELFKEGDYIGVALDLNIGTLSFSHNGNDLGIAVEGLTEVGELFPAVSLYNKDDKVTLVMPRSGESMSNTEEIANSSSDSKWSGVALANSIIGRISEAMSIIEALQSRSSETALNKDNFLMPISARTIQRVAYRCKLWSKSYLSTTSSERLKVLSNDSGCSESIPASLIVCDPKTLQTWGFQKKNTTIKTPNGEGRVVGVSGGRLYYKVPWIMVPSLVHSMRDSSARTRSDRSVKLLSPPSTIVDEFDAIFSTNPKEEKKPADSKADLSRFSLSRLVVPWNVNTPAKDAAVSNDQNDDEPDYDDLASLVSRFEAWTGDMDIQLVQYLNALAISRRCEFFQLEWRHLTSPSVSRYPAISGVKLYKIRERAALFIHLNQILQETSQLPDLILGKQANDKPNSKQKIWSPGRLIFYAKPYLLQSLKLEYIDMQSTRSIETKDDLLKKQGTFSFNIQQDRNSWDVIDNIDIAFRGYDVSSMKIQLNSMLVFSSAEAMRIVISTAVKEATMYSSSSLFRPSLNAIEQVGRHRRYYVINNAASNPNKDNQLQRFKAFGQLLRVIIESNFSLTEISFSPLFWKSIAGEKVSLDDLQAVNYEAAILLKEIRQAFGSKGDCASALARLKKSITQPTSKIIGKSSRFVVLPDFGKLPIQITESNVEAFVDAWESWLLYEEDKEEIAAIKEGFGLDALRLFESHNLELLLK
uniref:B30.2/SPRY domain-containing protein n=1 Tax=Aplanochytrium stocchinoi TaxID=215587 RepID=A0A7S3PF36_9STRA